MKAEKPRHLLTAQHCGQCRLLFPLDPRTSEKYGTNVTKLKTRFAQIEENMLLALAANHSLPNEAEPGFHITRRLGYRHSL